MTDAEKKWEEWDNEFTELEGILPAQCYRHSREAYKESLRSAIEKRIEEWDKHPQMSDGHLDMIGELKKVLRLLDQVTPKE